MCSSELNATPRIDRGTKPSSLATAAPAAAGGAGTAHQQRSLTNQVKAQQQKYEALLLGTTSTISSSTSSSWGGRNSPPTEVPGHSGNRSATNSTKPSSLAPAAPVAAGGSGTAHQQRNLTSQVKAQQQTYKTSRLMYKCDIPS